VPVSAPADYGSCGRSEPSAAGYDQAQEGTVVPIDARGVAYPAAVTEEMDLHGVLQPDGSDTWHVVDTPLAGRAVCGRPILYGVRVRAWDETPPADRCHLCLRQLDGS